jgi:diacylglycerol kinase (ATP)
MPQRKLLFILNPSAGGGQSRRMLAAVRAAAGEMGYAGEWRMTSAAGHAQAIAQAVAGHGFTRVVGVGGDGTLQEIANGLLQGGRPIELGVVPAGTGNDFARALGLPLDPAAATRIACGERVRPVDAALALGRCFINIAGAGLDGAVAAAVARRRGDGSPTGPIMYLACGIEALSRLKPQEVSIELDGQLLHRRIMLVAIGNGPFGGGGMMFCPEADPTDGLLDVCIVGEVPKWRALAMVPGLFRGQHVRHPAVEYQRARRIRIEPLQTHYAVPVHLDGEACDQLPLDVQILPAALLVAC